MRIMAILLFLGFSLSVSAQTAADKPKEIQRRAVRMDSSRPSSPLSPAIVAGHFVFVSGQLGVDPKTGEFAGSTTEEQAEQVLRNLASVLEAAGSDINHVVKTTVFLADMDDFSKMNAVYARHFKTDPPARSTIQVARLPRNGRIEIEAIAILKK